VRGRQAFFSRQQQRNSYTGEENKPGLFKKLVAKVTKEELPEAKPATTQICSAPIQEEFLLVPHQLVREFESVFESGLSKKYTTRVIPV